VKQESATLIEQMIRLGITGLPIEKQKEIFECIEQLHATVEKYGASGKIALAFLGAIIAAKEEANDDSGRS